MRDNDKNRYESVRQVGLLTTIPLLLLASPVVGFFLGKLLDRWLHTRFLTVVFLGLGLVAGVREVVQILRRASADSGSDTDDDSRPHDR